MKDWLPDGLTRVVQIPYKYGHAIALVMKQDRLYVTTTKNFLLAVDPNQMTVEEMMNPN